jgi:hypothetical protein
MRAFLIVMRPFDFANLSKMFYFCVMTCDEVGLEISMISSLNKWFRRFHRWFAYPFVILIILLIFLRQSDAGVVLLRIQQVMVFIMALTGCYLLLLPYLTKRRRAARQPKGGE